MTTPQAEYMQGTLDLLILKVLAEGKNHGWGVARRLKQVSHEVLQVNEGSLYPALHRLELKGWIKSGWGVSDRNRKAKFYELTAVGRTEVETETRKWRQFTIAVEQVLQLG